MSACPLCGSDQTSAVSTRDRQGRRLRTWLCESCGLVFNAPCPRPKALLQAYCDEQQKLDPAAPEPEIELTVRIFTRMERAITEYWPLVKEKRRVLDACAGSGEFAFCMRDLGFQIEALEPNPQYVAYCRRTLGLDVHAANFSDKSYKPGSFDFIRIHHLLVHSRDPVAELRKLRDWLADDGLLYVEVPNIEAEASVRARGEVFDVGHAYSFNPATLRAALASAGFEEAEETRERLGDVTAGFFRKGQVRPAKADAVNARRVSDAIMRHYNDALPLTKRLKRVLDGIAVRAARRREMRGLNGHRDAAEHFSQRLREKLQP